MPTAPEVPLSAAVLVADGMNAGPARVAANQLATYFSGRIIALALNWTKRERDMWLHVLPDVEIVDVSLWEARLPRGYGHISSATHARALIPAFVEERFAIYFDADTLVRRRVSHKDFFPSQSEHSTGGVRDPEMPFVGSDYSLAPLRAELNLHLNANAINAGVLAMDLERWREDELGGRILDVTNRYRLRGNSALNAVLNGQVQILPLTLNATVHMMRPSSRVFGWETFAEVDDARLDPAVVHFTGAVKPWHRNARLPFMDDWRAAAALAGWTKRSHSFSVRRRFERAAISILNSSLEEPH